MPAAFTSHDSIIQAATGYLDNIRSRQLVHCSKSIPFTVVNNYVSSWAGTGFPAAGTYGLQGKANGRACSKATAGAIPFPNAPAGKKWSRVGDVINQQNAVTGSITFLLADRTCDVLLASNETTGAISNCDGSARMGGTTGRGDGGQIIIETVTALTTASNNTGTVDYTNQNGGTSTSPTFTLVGGANSVAGRIAYNTVLWLPLATGDWSARALTKWTLASGTNAAGTIAAAIIRPIMMFGVPMSQQGLPTDMLKTLLKEVADTACLQLFAISDTLPPANALAPMVSLELVAA